jgi:hypothetical protein
MSTAPARNRSRPDEPTDTTPAEPGVYTARLCEGRKYTLASRDGGEDIVFLFGQDVPVTEEVFDHLAKQTIPVTHEQAGGRRTQEIRRRFRLVAPDGSVLPKTISETVCNEGGAVTAADPWA